MEKTHASKPSEFIVQMKENLQNKVDKLLGTDGIFLYPSHPRVAPKHHHTLFQPFDFAYTGQFCLKTKKTKTKKTQHSFHFPHCFIFSLGIINILGLPVTQCPLGLGEEGLPLGVQVVAGKLQDHLSLEVALFLEKTFGGWRDPGAK